MLSPVCEGHLWPQNQAGAPGASSGPRLRGTAWPASAGGSTGTVHEGAPLPPESRGGGSL